MYANNETGVILPVEKSAKLVKQINPKIKFHVDAVQAAGKIPIDVKNTDIDLLTIAGHKLHAPKGIGALYVKTGTLLPAFIIGGHQEKGKRAGTENVPYIVGLGKACELAQKSLDYEMTEVKRLRDKLEKGILKTIYNAKVNGATENRVPNTTNIGFQYIEGELILLHLSDLGICASSGSACTSGSLEPSHVLKSMGVPFESLHGSIRFSLSRFTTEEEIDYVLKVLPDVIFKLNNISPYQKELNNLKLSHINY
jgi:cysteine desulfurase